MTLAPVYLLEQDLARAVAVFDQSGSSRRSLVRGGSIACPIRLTRRVAELPLIAASRAQPNFVRAFRVSPCTDTAIIRLSSRAGEPALRHRGAVVLRATVERAPYPVRGQQLFDPLCRERRREPRVPACRFGQPGMLDYPPAASGMQEDAVTSNGNLYSQAKSANT